MIHLRDFHISTERKAEGLVQFECVRACVRVCECQISNRCNICYTTSLLFPSHFSSQCSKRGTTNISTLLFGNISHSFVFVFLLFFCVRFAKKQMADMSNAQPMVLVCLWPLVLLQLNSFYPRYSDCLKQQR